MRTPIMYWTGKNFVRGMKNLMVPVTTATEGQIEKWRPEEVWAPYWASFRDYCEVDENARELISIVMAKAVEPLLTTGEHRRRVEDWVSRHIPGYRLVWESELIYELNEALRSRGETVTAFAFGKDGRGALPDRYYHALAERKCLPIGNHHDILGHLLLFSDPGIRQVTERIIQVSAEGHNLWHRLAQYRDARLSVGSEQRAGFERTMMGAVRPAMALLTTSWNLAQEKIYFSETPTKGGSRFALMGAFNTVYNTTLSSRLSIEHAQSTVAGLGVLSADHRRTIVMLPRDLRRSLARCGEPVGARIERYADVLEAVGWQRDPEHAEVAEYTERFRKIVLENLFAQLGPFRLPIRTRWRRFGKAIQSDPFFGHLLHRKTMLRLAEGQIEIAAAALKYYAEYFETRTAGERAMATA